VFLNKSQICLLASMLSVSANLFKDTIFKRGALKGNPA